MTSTPTDSKTACDCCSFNFNLDDARASSIFIEAVNARRTDKAFAELGNFEADPSEAFFCNLREHFQNAIDQGKNVAKEAGKTLTGSVSTLPSGDLELVVSMGEGEGQEPFLRVTATTNSITMVQQNTVLPEIILSLYSTKRDVELVIPKPMDDSDHRLRLPADALMNLPGGAFGEGAKRSMESLVLQGFDVCMHNGEQTWTTCFVNDEKDIRHCYVVMTGRSDEYAEKPNPPLVTVFSRGVCPDHGNKTVTDLRACVMPERYLLFTPPAFKPGYPIVIKERASRNPRWIISILATDPAPGKKILSTGGLRLGDYHTFCLCDSFFSRHSLNRDRGEPRNLNPETIISLALNSAISGGKTIPVQLVEDVVACLNGLEGDDGIPIDVKNLSSEARKILFDAVRKETEIHNLVYVPVNSNNNLKDKARALNLEPKEHWLSRYYFILVCFLFASCLLLVCILFASYLLLICFLFASYFCFYRCFFMTLYYSVVL
jgi:hypothetical protein